MWRLSLCVAAFSRPRIGTSVISVPSPQDHSVTDPHAQGQRWYVTREWKESWRLPCRRSVGDRLPALVGGVGLLCLTHILSSRSGLCPVCQNEKFCLWGTWARPAGSRFSFPPCSGVLRSDLELPFALLPWGWACRQRSPVQGWRSHCSIFDSPPGTPWKPASPEICSLWILPLVTDRDLGTDGLKHESWGHRAHLGGSSKSPP